MSQSGISELDHLLMRVRARIPIVEQNYPVLAGATQEQKFAFVVDHSMKHWNKSLGLIAGESERRDHGGEMRIDVLREAGVKILVNALSFLDGIGMRGDDIVEDIPKVLK
jgi:hypothetical protein